MVLHCTALVSFLFHLRHEAGGETVLVVLGMLVTKAPHNPLIGVLLLCNMCCTTHGRPVRCTPGQGVHAVRADPTPKQHSTHASVNLVSQGPAPLSFLLHT